MRRCRRAIAGLSPPCPPDRSATYTSYRELKISAHDSFRRDLLIFRSGGPCVSGSHLRVPSTAPRGADQWRSDVMLSFALAIQFLGLDV